MDPSDPSWIISPLNPLSPVWQDTIWNPNRAPVGDIQPLSPEAALAIWGCAVLTVVIFVVAAIRDHCRKD